MRIKKRNDQKKNVMRKYRSLNYLWCAIREAIVVHIITSPDEKHLSFSCQLQHVQRNLSLLAWEKLYQTPNQLSFTFCLIFQLLLSISHSLTIDIKTLRHSGWFDIYYILKVRVKLRNLADLDFDLDPNWGITPNIETLYKYWGSSFKISQIMPGKVAQVVWNLHHLLQCCLIAICIIHSELGIHVSSTNI